MFLYNTSQQPNRKFVALTRQTAKEKSIPLQEELVIGYGDDAAEIQKSNGGVPTVTLVVPTRYTHAHTGVIDRRDFDGAVALLAEVLLKLDANAVGEISRF